MHRYYVEQLVADEERAILELVSQGVARRAERRGTLLVVEFTRSSYRQAETGAYRVPLLGSKQTSTTVVTFACDDFDTQAPSVAFARSWEEPETLPAGEWPKGKGVIERHYKTGRPFLCRPGVREYHEHFQHGGEPWERYRRAARPRHLVSDLANDLLYKLTG